MSKILKNIKIREMIGNMPTIISSVYIDSRKAIEDSMFISINGYNTNGHHYIDKAIESGAKVIVCEELPEIISEKACYIRVNDSAKAAGIIASNFYDNPSEKINLIGITGTNGKTTTATLLYNLFTYLGYYCGLISTVCIKIGEKEFEATHTTPDPISLNENLAKMADQGCEYCFMEVSSHAAHQQRISGLRFKGGIFTNITHDHLDYHKTFVNYIAAKKMFFNILPSDAFALTNIDDKNGLTMVENTKAKVYTYGINNIADFHAKIIEMHSEGSDVIINGKEVFFPLPAKFNVYNYLAAYAVAILCGVVEDELRAAISNISGAKGRFQLIPNKENKSIIVDYAHTPDALQNILTSVTGLPNLERIICVFGAGGDRDKSKRPIMGDIVSQYADIAIITSDNPRTENPKEIIKDILSGVKLENSKKVITITDRKEAIESAVRMMNKEDILIVAGKGHENYQEINGVKHHFDDVEIINEILN
jgi:UDP-N-acetylmuramoyl-L-alanyl-D-glutamate--2,6-diaminopimelate ligase